MLTKYLEFVALALLVIGPLVGCAHTTYYASDLPEEYAAPYIPGTSAYDLSRFAKPTTINDVVQAGDVLRVSITTGAEQRNAPRWDLRVDDSGAVLVPIVGQVRIAGMALSQADEAIYDAAVSRGYYRNPNVAVIRLDRRESRIVVGGAVKRPGSYDLPSASCDVLSAIVAAGGLGPNADTIVEVRQSNGSRLGGGDGHPEQLASYRDGTPDAGESPTIQLDLSNPQNHHDWDVVLSDGAVVTVRERPDQIVAVMGKVKRPGQFDMPNGADLRLLDAIALSGGRTTQFADKAFVVRQVSDRDEPILIRVSIRDAKGNPEANIRLAPGDVVSIEETPVTMGLATLKNIIRFSVSSSYRIF